MFNASQNKLVLCATAQHMLAGLWRRGKLQGSQKFVNDANGHEAFAEFLHIYPLMPIYLMVDAVEEDYRLESLPHTTGNAKRELTLRKLNQFYRGLEYRAAHFIKRDKEKRRDDKFLFVALNNADFLQAWITLIQAANAELVGVYLLPMLSNILVRKLKLMAPHILFCERLSSGLRQTYLHNGRLRMSRLIPNVPTAENQLGYFYLVETEKTRLYLISQRLISRETPLNLVLTSLDGNMQSISQNLSQTISQEQGIECTDINLSHIAKTLNLSLTTIQQMPELLHMHLLAGGFKVDNLAPQALTKNYQLITLKQKIQLASLAVGVIGMLTTGFLLKPGFEYKTATLQAMQDTAFQQHQYNEVAKDFPMTTISAADLKTAVEVDKIIAAYPKSPRRAMLAISAALELSPEIQLDRLRWTLTNDTNIKDEDKLIAMQVSTNLQPNGPLQASLDPAKLTEVGFVTAEISDFKGDYRAALNSVQKFVAALRADTRVAAVEVMQEPVNVSSFVDLQGSTSDEQTTQTQAPLFKLKVILSNIQSLDHSSQVNIP